MTQNFGSAQGAHRRDPRRIGRGPAPHPAALHRAAHDPREPQAAGEGEPRAGEARRGGVGRFLASGALSSVLGFSQFLGSLPIA